MYNWIGIILLSFIFILLLDVRYKISSKSSSKDVVVVDTSALIDGRILELVKSGFFPTTIVIHKSVLKELQLLADGRDTHKRLRASSGLNILKDLKEIEEIRIIISDKYKNIGFTDEIILELAKKYKYKLCTTDYNLNRIAVTEGIKVLNVNEISESLKVKILPGEKFNVKILHKGETASQGIGYTTDGTMVVVSGASKFVDKTVMVTAERYSQTKSGRLIFASLNNRENNRTKHSK